jgi:plasmid stabilization system protein ParE
VGAIPVVWSRRALADRDRIHAYVAAHSSPARAYAVIHAIVECAARLADNPDSGREIGPARREVVVPRIPYVVEYERKSNQVRLLYIWHQKQDRQARRR